MNHDTKKDSLNQEVQIAEEVASEIETDIASESLDTRKKKTFTAIGVLVFIFAVIGVITTIVFSVSGIGDLISRKGLKGKIEDAVYPLVIVDVPEFSEVSKLDPKTVITAGIWEFIIHHEDLQKYERDEYGTMVVPEVDIEPYIRALFGSDVEIEHQMIPDTEFFIPYDEENKTYLIPESPQLLPYAPEILSVSQDGKDYQVEVGYILPGPFWDLDRNKGGEYSKTMIYTLKKVDKDSFIILSVKMPKTETPNSSIDESLSSELISSEENGSSAPSSGTESEVTSGNTSQESSASQPAE